MGKVLNDPDLTSEDIEGWESEVSSLDDLPTYLKSIKTDKKLLSLEQQLAEKEGIEEEGEEDDLLRTLSASAGGPGNIDPTKVPESIQKLDEGYEVLGEMNKSEDDKGVDAAAAFLTLAHKDPRRVVGPPSEE